jgi:SulP family sulfate permease
MAIQVRKKRRADNSAAEYRKMLADWLESYREVVSGKFLASDFLAAVTVAAVALPLNLALAVASGLPPIAGLVAGAIGGILAGLFGGSRLQVTGPAAALNVMVLAIATDFGATGVAAAAMVIGLIQVALGAFRTGRVAKLVPESVLAGFTTGVGLKLLDSQIPEVLGFDYKVIELAQMMHRPAWLHHVSWGAVVCGLGVAFFVTSLRSYKRFPAAIVGLATVTFIALYLKWDVEKVGAVPSKLPRIGLPVLPDERWLDLIVRTVPLALLASVESLLSARAVDRMVDAKTPHNPDVELFGQGIANIGVGLMSGMPVSGVIVRSGVNAQSGGKTRLASVLHGVFLLLAVFYLSKVLAEVPLAALAGLLCVVGFRLVEVKALLHMVRTERIEAAAFVFTAAGTVSGHLMTGLVGGLVLHTVHRFIHRHENAASALSEQEKKEGVRAVLSKAHASARKPLHQIGESPEYHAWLRQIRERGSRARTAFVHNQASVIGKVVLGEHVHIAAGSSVRADEGSPFFIGDNSNIQDGVVIHALKDRKVVVGGEDWAVFVGRNVSMAHDALVHGPCYIGDDTFVGFKAVVHDSVVGSHCYIGIGAVVVGVEIPDGRFVPHGRIVDSADAVAQLPLVSDAHREFNEDVVEVNRGLATAYRRDAGTQHGPTRVVPARPARFSESDDEQPRWGHSDRF